MIALTNNYEKLCACIYFIFHKMFQEKQTFWDRRRRKAYQGSSNEIRDHLIKKGNKKGFPFKNSTNYMHGS